MIKKLQQFFDLLKHLPGFGWKTLLLAVLISVPFMDTNEYHLDVMVNAGIFAVLAMGLNIITGYCGLLNLGYAAFFAAGAYAYALLNVWWGWPFWVCLPMSIAAAGILGLVLGAAVLRLRGDYLAIVTLGFGEIVRITLNNLDSITGGPNGLNKIAHPSLWTPAGFYDFGITSKPYYYLILLAVMLIMWIAGRLEHSRLGRAWIAIKEDEVAAACMGIPAGKMKLLAFCVAACIAGLAGWLFAGKQGFVSPDSFDFITSVMIAAMLVLGGMGSIWGAILGAAVLTIVPEILQPLQQYRILLFGAVMVIMMIFRPQGILGGIRISEEFRPETSRVRQEEDEVLSEERQR